MIKALVFKSPPEGRYVQFGAVNPASAPNTEQELRRLYVHRDFQHAGYGTMLMEAALRHPQLHGAASISLDVWEHNHGAQQFYRRYGFEVISTRVFAVESGAATSLDLVMVRRSRHWASAPGRCYDSPCTQPENGWGALRVPSP